MTYYPQNGPAVRVDFEGDVFEMEDQRNWTDASFKTYCTPLSIPYPVEVHCGDKVCQSVRVTIGNDGIVADSKKSQRTGVVRASRKKGAFSLGSVIEHPLTSAQLERISALSLGHITYAYHFGSPARDYSETVSQIMQLRRPLRLVLFFTENWRAECADALKIVKSLRIVLRDITVFQEDVTVMDECMLEAIHKELLACGVPVGSGTNGFFTQVNRKHLSETALDFISYSNNPQVHAFDNASIMSTVEGQISNIRSCRAIYPALPIWIEPLSMKMRWNPDATANELRRPGQLPRDTDPRQMSLFAAAWFVRSFASCVTEDVAGASCFTLSGCTGIMEDANPMRDFAFPAAPGMLYPLYYAFYGLRELEQFDISVERAEDWIAVHLTAEGICRTVISNCTDHDVFCRPANFSGNALGLMVDETTVAQLADPAVAANLHCCYKDYVLDECIQLSRYAIFLVEFV